MKKILVILATLLLMPLSANAMAVSETFNVGDRVEVHVERDDKLDEFFVIKPSAPGEEYVWLLYNGNVGASNGEWQTVYDDYDPDTDTEATYIFENAYIKDIFNDAVSPWKARAAEMRLPELSDFTGLGIVVGSSGKYEIMNNKSYLAPAKLINTGEIMHFWTKTQGTSTTGASVYAVIYNTAYNNDSLTPVAFIESVDISDPMNNPEYSMRPVIKIHKQYIECNLSAPPSPENPVPQTPSENPPTSAGQVPFITFIIIGIAGLAYVMVRKKEVFEKI